MPNNRWPHLRIAAIIPCLDEEATIVDVIREVRLQLPEATIYVYDNGSTDQTAARAAAAGAIVRSEPRRGKGNVVCRMFADVDADIYFMTDGDLTYDLSQVGDHITLLLQRQLDMLVGTRQAVEQESYRFGHHQGNRLFNRLVNLLYGAQLIDIFSGYRVVSRRFSKTFPTTAKAFEIEAELTVHALDLRLDIVECPILYKPRPAGSASKLKTIQDGLAISMMLTILFKETKPFKFFGIWATLFVVTSLVLGYPLITAFLETGLVERLPTAVLASGLMVLGAISLICGLVLDSIGKARNELKRLHFLQHSVLSPSDDQGT